MESHFSLNTIGELEIVGIELSGRTASTFTSNDFGRCSTYIPDTFIHPYRGTVSVYVYGIPYWQYTYNI